MRAKSTHTTSNEGPLPRRTDQTHQNPMILRSFSGHWTHHWGALEQVSALERCSTMNSFEGEPGYGLQLALSKSWNKPSIQTRPITRTMEKHTGSSLLHSFPLLWKTENSKTLRQGENYLVSSHNTCGDVLKLCVIIHHYQPLSELSWASHQMFWFFFFFPLLLGTKSLFIPSLLQSKIRSNSKSIILIRCSFIGGFITT